MRNPKSALVTGLRILLAILAASAASAMASDTIPLASVPLWLPADTQLSDVDRALTGQIIDVMRAYTPPGGAGIRNYRVNGGPTWADASLEINKGFPIGRIGLEIHARAGEPVACNGIQGYRFELNLAGSDSRVLDQASAMRFELCFRAKGDGSFELAASSVMVEGGSYGGFQGNIVRRVLEGQHWPILLGMNSRILRNRAERQSR